MQSNTDESEIILKSAKNVPLLYRQPFKFDLPMGFEHENHLYLFNTKEALVYVFQVSPDGDMSKIRFKVKNTFANFFGCNPGKI